MIEATQHPFRITTNLTLVSALFSGLVNSAQRVSGCTQQKAATVVDDALAKDAAVVEDAAPASDSLADFPVTMTVVLMLSLVPDQTVTGFYSPLS